MLASDTTMSHHIYIDIRSHIEDRGASSGGEVLVMQILTQPRHELSIADMPYQCGVIRVDHLSPRVRHRRGEYQAHIYLKYPKTGGGKDAVDR